MSRLLLFIAQGFGAGRIPFAPGTFGSVLGLGWFALLLATHHPAIFFAGTLLGLALSVWLCGEGEKILGQKDPGSVVWDEIAAIPICFIGWMSVIAFKTDAFPGPEYFFSKSNWLPTIGIVALFRLFDIWKPWPVRQSQALPGGWGVTIDDALAAVYVNAVSLVILYLR